jgi:hypothetical protein
MRHPGEMGVTKVEAFLNMLTNARRVSVSTQNQALITFLSGGRPCQFFQATSP